MPTDQEEEQGPSTGWTNFASYFQANKGTAQKSADKYAAQATGAATQANDALENAGFQFNQQKNAGTVQQPNANVGTGAVPNRRGTNYNPASATQAANGSYTGPGAITDVSDFAPAVQKAQTAEDQLNGLGLVGKGGLGANGVPRGDLSTLTKAANPNAGPGANNFSANLIGSAGRQQFDALRAHFNPQKDVANAVTSSAAAGDAARKASDAAELAGQRIVNAPQPQAAAPSNQTGIPDSITTVDQAIAAGYGQDEIVKRFGFAAYDDSVGNAFQRGK